MEPELKELMTAVERCRDHGGCTMGSACDCDATDKRLLATVEREAAAFAVRLYEAAIDGCMCGAVQPEYVCGLHRELNRWRKVQEAG